MSQELVTIGGSQSSAVTTYTGASTGLEDVNIRPTKLILVQNGTREPQGARPGQLLDVLTGQAYDSLVVVPLRKMNQKVLFPPKDEELDLDAKPICRSSDAIVPSPFAEFPQAKNCKLCPKNKWGKTSTGKPIPPDCADKIKLLVIKKDEGVPRIFTVGGKGIKALNQRLEAIKQEIVMYKYQGIEVNLFDYFFTLSSDEVKGRSGKFYIPRFDKMGRVKDPGQFGPLFEEYVLRARQVDLEDEEEALEVQNEQKVDSTVGEVVTPEVIDVEAA